MGEVRCRSPCPESHRGVAHGLASRRTLLKTMPSRFRCPVDVSCGLSSFGWPRVRAKPTPCCHSVLVETRVCGLRVSPRHVQIQQPLHVTRSPLLQVGGFNYGDSYTPQCTCIKGLMVSIRWYLGFLTGQLGGAGSLIHFALTFREDLNRPS